jgi:hypothetical protein
MEGESFFWNTMEGESEKTFKKKLKGWNLNFEGVQKIQKIPNSKN